MNISSKKHVYVCILLILTVTGMDRNRGKSRGRKRDGESQRVMEEGARGGKSERHKTGKGSERETGRK